MISMNRYILFIISALFFSGCTTFLPPVVVQLSDTPLSYLTDVQPILDKRCVACHSCYNAACQAKYSSYEGVDRGASKIPVYDAMRLNAIKPTRLFHDAKTTQEWRTKGFYSVTQSDSSTAEERGDIFTHMIDYKRNNPEVVGSFSPESDTLMCPKDNGELADYFDEKPLHGMPYGFPALEAHEADTLIQWAAQGAMGPTPAEQAQLVSPSNQAAIEIEKWEAFLNQASMKHINTARYLYEHLYLAHIAFSTSPNEFYQLLRSSTPAPLPLQEIVTPRSFDDPQVDRVYYRFRKVHSTIVHKTHMVVALDDQRLAKINDQFINLTWDEKPHAISYNSVETANPIDLYSQIPSHSRYQFLLDNSHYIIMTFIKGPVCRGQIALNVIHDKFWVMFTDPDHDVTIQDPEFLAQQAHNLVTPIKTNDAALLKTFSNKYLDKYGKYVVAKTKRYNEVYPDGRGYESIWKGNTPEDAPMLTIFRHFDSASVHKGLLGSMPRTLWVIDYPQLERIYYSLVAGYDVFGNISHQTNIRRYMDFLRFEGEDNFLAYMPLDGRLAMGQSWYVGSDEVQNLTNDSITNYSESGIDFKTKHPKYEFIETLVNKHIFPETNVTLDPHNYLTAEEPKPKMPVKIKNSYDVNVAMQALTLPGTGFLTYITDFDINTVHIRVTLKDGSTKLTTMVINRWHDNVYSMLNESSTLNPSKDTIDFIDGSIGSYINLFVDLDYSDIPDFLTLIKYFDNSDEHRKLAHKYLISRADPEFWSMYDWFQAHFNAAKGNKSGLYDLNRYYKHAL